MFFGFQVQPIHLTVGGLIIFATLVFEMLVGLRKIKFKGRTHLRVHKAVAWALLVLTAVHGLAALLLFDIVSL